MFAVGKNDRPSSVLVRHLLADGTADPAFGYGGATRVCPTLPNEARNEELETAAMRDGNVELVWHYKISESGPYAFATMRLGAGQPGQGQPPESVVLRGSEWSKEFGGTNYGPIDRTGTTYLSKNDSLRVNARDCDGPGTADVSAVAWLGRALPLAVNEYPRLAEGRGKLVVMSRDSLGRTGRNSYAIVVDRQPPTLRATTVHGRVATLRYSDKLSGVEQPIVHLRLPVRGLRRVSLGTFDRSGNRSCWTVVLGRSGVRSIVRRIHGC